MSAPALRERIEACIARLDGAIDAARADKIVNIKDMEAEVESLSQAIMNAPIATGHEVQGVLGIMIARFDTLEGELRALQDRAGSAQEG